MTFAKLIRSPALAYWTIGIVMLVISWFFWPSPAVALIGAVLLPVAMRVDSYNDCGDVFDLI